MVRCSESLLIETQLVGVVRGLNYLHENEVIHGDLKSVIGVSSNFSSSRLTCYISQPNILIDEKGCPRLSDFGICSVTMDIESVNASTPDRGCTIRYCAPELLDLDGIVDLKRRKTKKSDIYSLSMVIVEVCFLCGSTGYPGSDHFALSLRPGRCRFLIMQTIMSSS